MNCGTAALGRAVGLVASLIVFTSTSVRAQTNSWVSPTSGKWEIGTNWSLGVPPGTGQMVFVANQGFKAVDIDNTTTTGFPQTMTIDSLSINSPTNSLNTVLMNFAGLQTPLTASSFIEVSNNANMVILHSAVQTGFFQTWPGGTVTEDVSSQVTASNLLDGGEYLFTNGTLTVPVANGTGETVSGQFVQAGGSNFTGGLLVTGDYDISGGELVIPVPGAPGQIGILDFANIVQSGGTVGDWLSVGQTGSSGGTYQLSGGLLQAAFIGLPGMSPMGEGTTPDSSFLIQTGGTNLVASISVGDELFGDPRLGLGTYLLTNGVLINSGGITINGQGNFFQEGGVESNASMTLAQTELISETSPFTNYFTPAHYFLDGGTFTSGSVSDQSSVFSQTGGSAQITTLTITGGAIFSQTGGTVTQTGTLTIDSSSVTAGNGTQHFGELLLSGTTNSGLTLASGASVLHFANSSGEAWSSAAMLLISNWNGSLSGGGEDQIFFGSDSTGLTAQQLSQVKFINPAGLAPGTYSAKILPDGEIVPSQGSSGGGLVNSWTNPGSGSWDVATNWSLGILPDSAQMVLITNAGFKAVSIQSSTPINFPGSMSVSNLTIASPTNSANTLLMNFVGAGSPLVVGVNSNNPGSLIIGDTNSAMVMLSSGLIVNNALGTNNSRQGEFAVNGTFTQSDNSEVVAGFLDLNNGGTYNLTNGQLFIGSQFINGTFNQQGGTNFGAVVFTDGGKYNLFDGLLQGSVEFDASFGGQFNQSGGTNISSLGLGNPGVYQLSGGLLLPGDLQVGPSTLLPTSVGAGVVLQTGGTDNAGDITMGVGSYTLEGGVLTASNLTLPTVSDRLGSFGSSFDQSGGFFSSGSVNMSGVVDSRNGLQPSTYTLSGGELQTPAVNMTMGLVDQTGGTNNVGVVTLNTDSAYNFTNGLLIATNIQVEGQSTFVHAGGSFGGPDNILLAGGSWMERTAGEQFGQLQLGTNSNSFLNLPTGSCVLRFANSSAVPWAVGDKLTIQNWSGSTNGGGAQQVFFGTSASGLTAQQLSQVQFSNPAGLPAGTYSARILSDGEVVPNEVIAASIGFSHEGNSLVLTWPTGWILQSATNAAGPYTDVPGATSPYTINVTAQPQQFFRLRQQ